MTAPQASSRNDLFYPAPAHPTDLMGLPHLMEMAVRGMPLEPIAQGLIERATQNPHDSHALMDLACTLHLTGQAQWAQRIQADALALSRCHTLPAQGPARLRVLSIMTPGALMDNAPIEFLLHGSDIELDMLYVDPNQQPLQLDLPPHDVAFMAVSESDEAKTVLQNLSLALPHFPHATLNDPARVLALARDRAWQGLQSVPGCVMPPTCLAEREQLASVCRGELSLAALLPGAQFPLICRPRGSHAGRGLVKLQSVRELTQHLREDDSSHFYLSNFVDYASPDGQYRKYRVALVGGQAFPVHLALSARWMVHYLNGDMAERPDNRAQEQHFFDAFDQDFAARHAQALTAIDAQVGLDYVSIDCGETPDGRLLVFEIDSGGVVHAMDPLDDYGYKRPHMLRLFAAFQNLLTRASQDASVLKPKTPATLTHAGGHWA